VQYNLMSVTAKRATGERKAVRERTREVSDSCARGAHADWRGLLVCVCGLKRANERRSHLTTMNLEVERMESMLETINPCGRVRPRKRGVKSLHS
jgi:hypothetical protein